MLACFVAVNLWNVCAIVKYGTSWWELLSVWYAVLFVTAVVYVLLIPLRYLGCLLWKLVRRGVCRKAKA